MKELSKTLDFCGNSRVSQSFDAALKSTLKYILLICNVLIISDAIFLLIHEKDNYQENFIDDGRHQISKLVLLMLFLDVQSFIMILIGVFGIIGMWKMETSYKQSAHLCNIVLFHAQVLVGRASLCWPSTPVSWL